MLVTLTGSRTKPAKASLVAVLALCGCALGACAGKSAGHTSDASGGRVGATVADGSAGNDAGTADLRAEARRGCNAPENPRPCHYTYFLFLEEPDVRGQTGEVRPGENIMISVTEGNGSGGDVYDSFCPTLVADPGITFLGPSFNNARCTYPLERLEPGESATYEWTAIVDTTVRSETVLYLAAYDASAVCRCADGAWLDFSLIVE